MTTRGSSALFLLDEEHWETVYGLEERARLERLVQEPVRFFTRESIRYSSDALARVETIFSGWGMEHCGADFLSRAPRLRAIFHAGGSVRQMVSDAMWERGIRISTANAALAEAVAEFTLAQVILSLKGGWRQALEVRRNRSFTRQASPGVFKSTVGLISLGTIARHLISLLRPFNLKIVAYDPLVSPATAKQLGVGLHSLDGIFALSDVVSVHTPLLPETERLIRAHHFERMRPGATFINTARGAIVDEEEFISVFSRRPELFALLDVTCPEPPLASSPLYDLPNVMITPHIAGTLGRECQRLGGMVVDEYERYVRGESLKGELTRELLIHAA